MHTANKQSEMVLKFDKTAQNFYAYHKFWMIRGGQCPLGPSTSFAPDLHLHTTDFRLS